jgi:hypothetical protein
LCVTPLAVQWILSIVVAYLATGLVFGIAFVVHGVARADPAARAAPVGFRLLICPARRRCGR